jgi:hypothetical protein
VFAHDAAVVLLGAQVDVDRRPEVGEELAEGGLAADGVKPGSFALIGFHVVDVVLRGLLGGESGDRAYGVVAAAVTDAPGVVAALFCPGHVDLLRRGVGVTDVTCT